MSCIEISANRYGSLLAVQGDHTLSFQEWHHLVSEQENVLRTLGIQSGDRVALIATSTLHTLTSFFALLHMQATPCMLSFRAPKEQIAMFVMRAKASHLLTETNHSSYRDYPRNFPPEIILFTSGSQGTPKLVRLRVEHFIANAYSAISPLRLEEGKSHYLLSTPLFHVSGLIIPFRTLLSGACLDLTPSTSITHISCVPTQVIRYLRESSFPFPRLQALLLGGAPITESLLKECHRQNIPIHTTYGLTEMASQVTMSRKEDSLASLHLGTPLMNREVKLASDGEILVRGPSLFSGYDDDLLPPLTEDGFFATGDLGTFTQDGHLIYKGRKDHLFISGGENIYPEEIERALSKVPGILFSLVIPIDDAEFGERPIAFLETEGEMPSKEMLYEHLQVELPKFAWPVAFYAFPSALQGNAKITRKQLRHHFETCKLSSPACMT